MYKLTFASISLDGVSSFLALFIFLIICAGCGFLSLAYLIKSNQLERFETANKRLHNENLLLKKERDKFSEKFYVADFQLRMKSRELDELKEAPQNSEDTEEISKDV